MNPSPTPPLDPSLVTIVEQSPVLAGTVAAVLGGLILAALYKVPKLTPLYKAIGGSIVRAGKWLAGLRVMSRTQRQELEKSGYDRRSAEVRAERKKSPRPMWRVSHTAGDDFIYVHNAGWWVEDVVVHADPELFVFADGAASGFIKGRLGDNRRGGSSGKQIPGTLTEKGRKEGVEFSFSWTDQNGDTQPATGGPEMPSRATLAAAPLLPHVQPAWRVGKPRDTKHLHVWGLVNAAAGSITRNVRIDADPNLFTFLAKRELGDLEAPGILAFAGRPTERGTLWGVDFEVTYEDVNGREHVDVVPTQFGMGL